MRGSRASNSGSATSLHPGSTGKDEVCSSPKPSAELETPTRATFAYCL